MLHCMESGIWQGFSRDAVIALQQIALQKTLDTPKARPCLPTESLTVTTHQVRAPILPPCSIHAPAATAMTPGCQWWAAPGWLRARHQRTSNQLR
jgi:hypothetical protein